jgi:hypothetical protein
MPSICICLDPARLPNTTADLRYDLPAMLAERSGGAIRDNGFDYGKTSNFMFVFLDVDDIAETLPMVLDVITNGPVPNDILAPAAVIATTEIDHCDRAEEYRIVFPADYAGPFTFE